MKAALQSKRKAFPGQTEAERWGQIFRILFPNIEQVPDPYFEQVRDNEESFSPDIPAMNNFFVAMSYDWSEVLERPR
ncbi:hypothetical protein L207DRAFT_593305 [Hyaloscypha variabilis F]|uniref:Uncharacterized protein n=1 Tax=Hyaloscypha variabilis (strain UAMH 11265 / GT02V1 / F) TaxID=1149755 RepID=A0A2J6QTB6_HYAVF|nr:hypothetical protein L207DRAFT_593305 [Hyaloscypha variabilis F]